MLEEEAAREGQEPDDLLVSLVDEALLRRRSVGVPGIASQAGESEAERFRQWADGQPRRGIPVIPLEALDREHLYGDHA